MNQVALIIQHITCTYELEQVTASDPLFYHYRLLSLMVQVLENDVVQLSLWHNVIYNKQKDTKFDNAVCTRCGEAVETSMNVQRVAYMDCFI